MTKTVDLHGLLLKAAGRLDNPDEATTSDLLDEFFKGLEGVIVEQIPQEGTGPLTKVKLQGMHAVLDAVTKMSDADLRQWLAMGRHPSGNSSDSGPARRFDRKSHPEDDNPDTNYAATRTPAPAPDKNWDGTPPMFPGTSSGKPIGEGTPHVIPSSSPAPGMAKSIGDFLDMMDGATVEDIDRAKTGLSQLDSDVLETLNKAIEERGQLIQAIRARDPDMMTRLEKMSDDDRGQLLQSLNIDLADPAEERALYMGNLLSETELRKGIIVSSAKLLERVAKMRDENLSKQVVLTGDPDDDGWEQRARQGQG